MAGKGRTDLWTVADLARLAKVTERTVHRWKADGLPVRIVDRQPRIAPEAFIEWLQAKHRQELADAAKARKGDGEKRNLLDEETALKIQLLELKLAKEREEVAPVALFGVALGRMLDRVAARLRALPIQLSHLGTEAELAAEAEVERVVQELHDMDDDLLDEEPPAPALAA
jgi:phage terminase Nu1 subunit (DNA packaging protein)